MSHEDKVYPGYRRNAHYEDKIYINYNLNAYCKGCNMEFPKPKSNCPVCHKALRQHSKIRDDIL
jgi:rRNA maturation endonuclease Nob1